MRFSLMIVVLALTAAGAFAGLQVPNVLSDGMVFQQNRPARVWGGGTAGSQIRVALMRAADGSVVDSAATTVDADGHWMLTLGEQTASYKEYSLRIEDDQDVIEIHDVLFGEVWMVSGQSNMQLKLRYILNNEDIKTAINARGNKYIRGLDGNTGIVPGTMPCSQKPLGDIPAARWGNAADFDSVADLSGVGMTFALKLFDYLNQHGKEVPIAIMSMAKGGTSIHAWLSYEASQSSADLKEKYPREWSGRGDDKKDFNQATACYNHLVAPATNFSMAGILWYQGENNVGNQAAAEYYREALATLIESWRKEFSSPNAAAIAVQLAPHHYWDNLAAAAFLREAQDEAVRLDVDPAGMAMPIHDLELTWKSDTFRYDAPIHPLAKQEVGNRLANAAYAMTYGGDVEYLGPVLESMDPKNGGLEISFTHTMGGLTTVDGSGNTLRGFSICGRDRVFYPARAEIIGDHTVFLSNSNVLAPVAATYGFFSLNQHANLANGAGLPASPFRTDKVKSVYNAPLQWMHCDSLTAWYNTKKKATFVDAWRGSPEVMELSLTDKKREGEAALRIDYSVEGSMSRGVVLSPVLEPGDLHLDAYPGMSLSLYKAGSEAFNVLMVFVAKDGTRHRLQGISASGGSYDGLPVADSGWNELAFSFNAPHLDPDGTTASPMGSLSEIQKLELILTIPEQVPDESYILLDDIQLGMNHSHSN